MSRRSRKLRQTQITGQPHGVTDTLTPSRELLVSACEGAGREHATSGLSLHGQDRASTISSNTGYGFGGDIDVRLSPGALPSAGEQRPSRRNCSRGVISIADHLFLRSAEPTEATLVHRLMREAFEEYRDSLVPPTGALQETVPDVEAVMARGGAVLAFWDGEPAGSARFTWEDGYMYIGRVSVPPRFRRRGIARAMVHWLEDHARRQGWREVRLAVRSGLPSNLALYTGMGYVITGYASHPGYEKTIVWMAKQLVPPT